MTVRPRATNIILNTPGMEQRIRDLHAQGLSLRAIAKLTGIAKSIIHRYLSQSRATSP